MRSSSSTPRTRAAQIVDGVAGRSVVAVVVTHGHDDTSPSRRTGAHPDAPVLLHPGDDMLWKATHPEERYWNLDAGQRIGVAGTEIEVTPHAGSLARIGLPVPARGGRLVLRRHAVQRWPGRHRPLLQRFSHHRRSIRDVAVRACPRTPGSTPATATTPPSAPKRRTSPNGSRGGTEHGGSDPDKFDLRRRTDTVVTEASRWVTVR